MQAFPTKRTATIDGQTLEYVTSGSGAPPIVLINGSGGPIEGWHKVYAELERLGTVFAYNRPGLGGSGAPTSPQNGTAVVATLRALLAAAQLRPPYLLVGHSLGGLYVNLFARLHPDEVAGAVLLDSAAPGDEILQTQHQTAFQRATNAVLGRFSRPKPHEETNFVEATVRHIAEAGPFPPIPLTVISGCKLPPAWLMSPAAWQVRREGQRALAALSPLGRQIVAERSGHFPQFSEPELVVKAVREVREATVRE